MLTFDEFMADGILLPAEFLVLTFSSQKVFSSTGFPACAPTQAEKPALPKQKKEVKELDSFKGPGS